MKKLIAVALVLAALAPAIAAQTPASFTGRWEGTFKMQRPLWELDEATWCARR